MVALPPLNLPRSPAREAPVSRAASNTIGEFGLPSRMPKRLKTNCWPMSWPPLRRRAAAAAEPAVQHRAVESRAGETGPPGGLETIAGPIGQTGRRVGPSATLLIRKRLKLTTAQEVPKAKPPPSPIRPSIGRRSACTRPPGKAPSSWACGAQQGRVARPGPEADRAQREPLPARRIRLNVGDPAHRRIGVWLPQADPPLRQAAAAHLHVAVDAQTAGRPIISDTAAAEDAGPRAIWSADVGAGDPRRAAAGEVHDADLAGDVEPVCGPADGLADGRGDRPDWGGRGRGKRLGDAGEHRGSSACASVAKSPIKAKVPAFRPR